jgi:predicted enzyme related to lactoylglutathione lyase
MDNRIRHLAIVSENSPKASAFYEAVFGVNREEGRGVFTDGYVGFNINGRRNGNNSGFNHFGFSVESVPEIEERIQELYPQVGVIGRPSRPFAGWGTHDLEGNAFDLSPTEFERRGVYTLLGDNPNERHVSHFQLNAMDPERLAKFYKDVFELKELTKEEGDERFYLTDGFITMVLAPWKITNYPGAIDYKPLPDHFGWHVEDMGKFLDDLERISKDHPELAPKGFSTEGELRKELLAKCSLGQFQFADSEGVLLDVSDH